MGTTDYILGKDEPIEFNGTEEEIIFQFKSFVDNKSAKELFKKLISKNNKFCKVSIICGHDNLHNLGEKQINIFNLIKDKNCKKFVACKKNDFHKELLNNKKEIKPNSNTVIVKKYVIKIDKVLLIAICVLLGFVFNNCQFQITFTDLLGVADLIINNPKLTQQEECVYIFLKNNNWKYSNGKIGHCIKNSQVCVFKRSNVCHMSTKEFAETVLELNNKNIVKIKSVTETEKINNI